MLIWYYKYIMCSGDYDDDDGTTSSPRNSTKAASDFWLFINVRIKYFRNETRAE